MDRVLGYRIWSDRYRWAASQGAAAIGATRAGRAMERGLGKGMIRMRTDLELLVAWRGGDRDAANLLFDRHLRSLTRFFRRRVGDRAEDLVQDTLLACVRGRDRFAGDATFRTYMYATARRVLRRARASWSRHEERVDFDTDTLPAMEASLDRLAARRREQELLVLALAQLSSADRRALELFFGSELTGAQVGEALGVPEPTARSRIRLALARLRSAVDRLAREKKHVAPFVVIELPPGGTTGR